MEDFTKLKREIAQDGFTVINHIFSDIELEAIINCIELADTTKETFRRSADLFAIRQFLKEVPQTVPLIFVEELNSVIRKLFGNDYFVVKSIYFDKPGESNWFVSYHQDLTISVNNKVDIKGFGPWTTKQHQYAVQPPLHILKDNFTIRIHLDDTDESNGALRVIPKSHLEGVYRPETIDWSKEKEVSCDVKRGGVMFMRPLLLHASSRTTSNRKRRVIHIEFSNKALPEPLQWSELIEDMLAGNMVFMK